MLRAALIIFVFSAFLSGLYYFNKCRAYETYRIPNLDSRASLKKSYRININLATAREFQNLPGIGPKLALRIVQDRELNGDFKSIQDISRVRGIGDSKLAKFIQYLSL